MNRKQQSEKLCTESFDVLVIGGGATGAGIALDATLRGYKTALVEAHDFSSGASSASTKLLHGGVRYLEKAFLRLDLKQLHLVKNSLQERSTLLQIAPHLTNVISLVLPVSSFFQKFYYWAGLQIYERLSKDKAFGRCHWLSAEDVENSLPGISQQVIRGGVSYNDGQFDDARFNIALIQTAIESGAAAINYVEFIDFTKTNGVVSGAMVRDKISGEIGAIKASIIVNATGCMSDKIRSMDCPLATPLLAPSRGSHIVFNHTDLPLRAGFLIPVTSDGRVIFGLPWQGKVVVGTTEVSCDPEASPMPTDQEVAFLLEHLNKYFSTPLRQDQIVATWAGIRPLFHNRTNASTSDLSRDHYIERSSTGLYSIVGGKWTTYRLMAKDLIDRVIKDGNLPKRKECSTQTKKLIGASGYSPTLADELESHHVLPKDTCLHLAKSYGGNAWKILEYAKQGLSSRLHEQYPFVKAEIPYCLHEEYATSAADILYRRLRLGFLDTNATEELTQQIDEIIKLC